MSCVKEITAGICKRQVLSDASKLYDPLWVSSVLLCSLERSSYRNYGVQTSLVGVKNYSSTVTLARMGGVN